MARVISVFLPMWPVDRLRRQDGTPSDRPLVLAGRIGSRRVVTAVDALAAGVGLRPGMPVSKAQALVPDLRIAPANVAEDLASLERLAFWILQRIAPIVAVDPPDGIVIDATGAAHLHGGEDPMLEALTGGGRSEAILSHFVAQIKAEESGELRAALRRLARKSSPR